MSLELRLKWEGLGAIVKKLERYQQQLKQDRAMFTKMAVQGFKDIQDHFRQEKGPEGRWQSLSQATIKARRKGPKKGRSPKILQDTGRLKNSLLPTTGGLRFFPNGVILYTDLEYAAAHNFGMDALPKREFMWLSGEAKDRIKQIVLDHITKHGT